MGSTQKFWLKVNWGKDWDPKNIFQAKVLREKLLHGNYAQKF
jgi:hypothetical protein